MTKSKPPKPDSDTSGAARIDPEPPVAHPEAPDTPAEPVGHYGPGYGDPTPVDPDADKTPPPLERR